MSYGSSYTPDYDKLGNRNKLVSKKIKMLRKEGKPQKQSVAIALNTYPKTRIKPLANKY
tara:strand:+ start:2585 stop:2761 length:177 start_codon:yes stop_codon:yes gene_type:complete